MKRISLSSQGKSHYFSTFIVLCLGLSSLNSCSWVSSRRSLFGGDDEKKEEATASVSKEQFDELAKKYQTLLKERRMEKVESPQAANQMMNQMEGSSAEASADVINQLGKVRDNAELAETVDVFSKKNSAMNSSQASSANNDLPMSPMSTGNLPSGVIEDHIAKIRKAEKLVSANKFDQSMTLIKDLEKSPVRQIVVRAKFLLGEILFKQGEYDLSMQVFEEILEKHAFSGLVIKTLGRLIVCSEKLKVKQKQEKYYSILHDFFEQGA